MLFYVLFVAADAVVCNYGAPKQTGADIVICSFCGDAAKSGEQLIHGSMASAKSLASLGYNFSDLWLSQL
mgnify:FL=1